MNFHNKKMFETSPLITNPNVTNNEFKFRFFFGLKTNLFIFSYQKYHSFDIYVYLCVE